MDNWTGVAAAAFGLGILIQLATVDSFAGPAGGAAPELRLSSPAPVLAGAAATREPGAFVPFGIEDGAFRSERSLFVPLALADAHANDLAAQGVDLDRARRAAAVIDELNAALRLAGHQTYRQYVLAAESGEAPRHPAVDLAYPSVEALTAEDAVNLRQALDHIALASGVTPRRKVNAQSDPLSAAANAISRAFGLAR